MPTPRQHALLSASSAHRWLACTAAPHFEESFPDGTSSYAEEGTLAHAICELYARKKFTVLSTRKFNSELKKLQARPLYSDEMLRTAEAYVEYLTEKAMQYATPPHVAMEVKVDLTAYVPDGFGTCDCIMIGGDTLHITDYKHGKGVPVSAENNPQMRLYSRYRTEREAMYKRIIEKYEKTERMVFPELVEDVVNAFDADSEQDFLGSAYMELELGNHWIGQFFTPYDICRCMAEITTGDVVEQINRDGFVTLNDCACGAGATLIAAVNQIEKQLFEAKSPLRWQNHVLVTAQDLDFTTGMMCYIQLSLLGCAGYIKIGNTLTDPMHDGDDPTAYWYTPGYFSSVWQLRRIFRSMQDLSL